MANFHHWVIALIILEFAHCSTDLSSQEECIRACTLEFSAQTDAIFDEHVTKSRHMSSLSYKDLVTLAASNENRLHTKRRFANLCVAYKTMTHCVTRCPNTDPPIAKHDPLKFICIDRRRDFERHMDCLAANEPFVEKRCERETNQTNIVTKELTEMYTQPSEHMPQLLDRLCGNVREMVKCIVPETAVLCGSDSADVVQDMIVQSFQSLTSLFNAMDMQVPYNCQDLVSQIKVRHSGIQRIPSPYEYDPELLVGNNANHFMKVCNNTLCIVFTINCLILSLLRFGFNDS